jgi:uncharacterized protein (TIGR00255 family)
MHTVASMTGFARSEGARDGVSWIWELRSVNGRGLDLRLRLPPGFESLEPGLRKRIGQDLVRGSVSATLTLMRSGGVPRLKVNTEALEQILELIGDLQQRVSAEPPRLDGLLALRGVLEPADEAEGPEVRQALEGDILAAFDRAADALVTMRRGEGAALTSVTNGQLDEIFHLAEAAGRLAVLQPAAIRARLAAVVGELLSAAPALPEERLAQEAVLLAAKTDAREELDRIAAHVAAARQLLAGGGPIGRRLDFLCQELNRETNTLCSKSDSLELTRIGLALKATIDQLREQVQNIE